MKYLIMKEIKLTQGKVALVDDEDFEYLNQVKWYASHQRNWYANRDLFIGKKRIHIIMHRLIMNTPMHLEVDHIDHNGLNNQKSNLRNCTRRQNGKNIRPRNNYLGVYFNTEGYISAKIYNDGKSIHLGYFKTEIDAAKARDDASKKYFGEFAHLNFK
jgi:hypothetical protein